MGRWYQWHRSSCVVLFVLMSLALAANLAPRQTEQPQDRVIHGADQMYYLGQAYDEWGWPLVWRRVPTGEPNPYAVPFNARFAIASGEYAQRQPVEVFKRFPWLAVDLLCCAALAAVLAGLFEYRRRRRGGVWQFTLFDLSAATVLIAVSIAGYRELAESNYVIEQIERADGVVSATWSGPTWLGTLRPVTVTEIVFRREPTPRIRREVARWSALRQIWFLNVPLEDKDLSWLGGLQQLETLDLSNSGIADAQLAPLSKLTGLRRLSLARNEQITGGNALRHLAGLPQLRALDLGSTHVSGAGFEHLARLPRLQTLELYQTALESDALARLAVPSQPLRRSLQSLNLWGAQLAGDVGVSLAQFPNLRTLQINSATFGLADAEHLLPLEELREVEFDNTALHQYITRQINRHRDPYRVADPYRAANWQHDEVGLWTFLLERGHRAYVQRMVRRAFYQPSRPKQREEVLRLVPKVLPREEAVPELKRLMDTRRGVPWYRIVAAWAEYGLDPELVERCRAALVDRSQPYWALSVCFSYPPYAQALFPELCALLHRDFNVPYVVQALALCGEQAVAPLTAYQQRSPRAANVVLSYLGSSYSEQAWIDELIAANREHLDKAVRISADTAARQRAGMRTIRAKP